MNYTLKDLLDVPRLRELLDAMDEIHSMPSAILDREGNILTATAWQNICTKFHRMNPDTEKKCIESDTRIKAGLDLELPYVIYRCPMGLVDAAKPIIIEGKHLGNVFVGQLFMEPPDEEYFKKQAHQYGFDEDEYLAAMQSVPFFPEEKFLKNLTFIHSLTQMLAEQGLQHKRQCEAEKALLKKEELYRELFASAGEGIIILSPDGRLIKVNESFAGLHGYSPSEMQKMGLKDVDTPETSRLAPERMRRILAGETLFFEVEHYHKDGHVFPLEVTANLITAGGESYFQCFHRDITDRKRAERALRESESRFRSIFDHSPIAIGIGDIRNGELVEVNDAWLRLLGYKRDEVIGRTVEELSIFVRTEERGEIIRVIQDQGRVVNHPVRFRQKSGSLIDIHYSAEIVTFDMRPCLLVMMTDTTDHKHAEVLLKESEEKFSKAFSASPEAISINSMEDGTYIDVNDVFLYITGCRRDEVIGHTSSELGFWIDPDERYRFLEKLSETGSIKNYETRYRMKNLEEKDFLVSSEAIEIAGKQCSLNFIMDITERKRAEDALKESEFFFKESQRSANIGSYKADFTTNYWKPSEVLRTIFGIDENYDCSVQGWIEIVHPDDRNMMEHHLKEEVMSRRKPFSKEYRIVRKNDGETRWVNGLGEATFDSQGAMLSLYGTIQDITENRLIEEERSNLQQQLLQAQKLDSLGVLAGGIAHDFNNLLAVIIGRCSLARLRPATAVDNIAPIETAAERAAELCQQMLAYAGKANIAKSRIRLDELVDEMVRMSKSTIGKNVKITSDLASDIPPLIADASQIRQVAMNLIINASEAIGESQGEVRVSLAKRSVEAGHQEKDHLGAIIPSGRYACLEVSDNGCGMDDETKQRIFEPFYTTKFTGRGLGMSAVLGIIRTHKGALQLFSHPGQGSTFRVYLPVEMSAPAESQSTTQSASPESWQGTGTVLLVEDEEQVICIAESMLAALGFKVIKASNGEEALDLFKQNAEVITLIVTDIGMPVMDGYSLVRELKKIPSAPPIIISSGFGGKDITSRIAPEDFAGMVSKPYNFNQLQVVVKNVVGVR